MPSYPAFIGGSYPAQAWSADVERSVNLFVEKHQSPGAKGPASLIGTPGFTAWSQGGAITDVVGRAACVADGRLFMVIGGGLYEFDANGTATKRSTIVMAQDANPAQLRYNGKVAGQLLVASGTNAYCLILATNAFSQVLTGKASMIAYCQGFFLAFELATGKVYESNLNDGTVWNTGAIFFQRSLFADPWQAMFVDGNSLVWLVGSESFEVWYNTGIGTQPFAPLSGLNGTFGIAAPFAWAEAPIPVWLTSNQQGAGVLTAFRGGSIGPLSNYAISSKISTIARTSRISDAELLPYMDGGHTFLNLALPGGPSTLTCDLEGDSWAERGKWNVARGDYDLWAPRTHVLAFGKHLVGDRTTGTVWQMDNSFQRDTDGAGIRRLRVAPAITREGARIPIDKLQLLVDAGVGIAGADDATPGVNPKLMLRVSNNGGKTWGNERRAGLGRIGKWKTRVYWTRLGANDDMSVEVTCSDPVPVRITGAWINPTEAEERAA